MSSLSWTFLIASGLPTRHKSFTIILMSKHKVEYNHYDKDHPYLSTLSIKKRANYDRTHKIALSVVVVLFFVLAEGMLMWATADSSISYSPLQKEASAIAKPVIKLSKVEVKLSDPPPPLLYLADMYLVIPRLSINVPISNSTLANDAKLAIPRSSSQALWRKDGPKPGETGSVVIAGPYGDLSGDGPLSLNNNLVVGDSIEVIYKNGNRVVYKVYQTTTYKLAEVPLKDIFDKSDGKYLNLITDAGSRDNASGEFDQRLVVYTKQD